MRLARRWLVPLLVLFVSACGEAPPPSAPTPTPPALVRVDVDGPAQQEIGTPGGTLQLRAVATLADGTRPDVTNEAAWSATDPRVLAVSSRGLVTAIAVGGTFVTATYRERAGATNVTVGPLGGPLVPVTGVVLDADRGTPVVGADITESGFEDERRLVARTDGNGFFSLGDRRGRVVFRADSFGYQGTDVVLDNVRAAVTVDVRLKGNPGDYIERRVMGGFPPVAGSTEGQTTVRITTRAGGLIDAMARSLPCEPAPSSGTLLWQESGGRAGSPARAGACEWARLRFVAAASDVLFTIRGFNATNWELVFREPR